jgi:hypothetical protein
MQVIYAESAANCVDCGAKTRRVEVEGYVRVRRCSPCAVVDTTI